MQPRPLSTLLSRGLLQLARDYRRAGAVVGSDSSPTLLVWSNALRYLDDVGIRVVDVHRTARLSRRMVKPLVIDRFTRSGDLAIETRPGRGNSVAKLTPKGRAMREAWAPLMDATTAGWTQRFGAARVSSLRAALEDLVSRFDLEHPHFPVGYGAVDDSVTGGHAVPGSEGPPFIPPHGKDWIPVIRDGEDTVSDLPLPALLSQALVEYAMQLELGREVSLSVAWMLRWLPDDGAPARVVAATWGDNFKLKAAIERARIMQVVDGTVTLTPRGRALRDKQQAAIAAIEKRWRRRYGDSSVTAVRNSLEAIDSSLDDDLPDHPMVSWVGGVRVIGADT